MCDKSPRARALLVAALLGALGACATTVKAPPTPPDPRPVFLLVHGRHASLVLATGEAQLVRYAYGDWRWYAQNRTQPWYGVAALLWPTPAALGRRAFAGPATEDNLRRQLRVGIEALHRLQVTGAAADALHAELEALFRSAAEAPHYNPDYDLFFVPHPTPYTLFHNSNRAVAGWLERLGCEVHGGDLLTSWSIVPPP